MKKYLKMLFFLGLIFSAPFSQAQQEVYKVGTIDNQIPMNFKDENGLLVGMEIDLMNRIAELEGFKIEYVPSKWEGLLPGIDDKSFDIVISTISYTEERNEKYALSNAYLTNPAAIMVTDRNPNVKELADLSSLIVGAMPGSVQLETVKAYPVKEIQEFNDEFLSFKALVQGKVDAILNDSVILEYLAKSYENKNLGLKVIPYEDPNTPTAKLVIVMAKDNTALKEKINRGIRKLTESGEINALSEKWLNFKPK